MRITLKDFTGGINRANDPTKMRDNEFYDFQNLVIYKLGALGNAIKRAGFEIWNTGVGTPLPSITTNQIFQYVTNAKSSNFDRLIIKGGDDLYYVPTASSGDNYTKISDSDKTGKVKFAVFRDNLYELNRNTGGTYSANKFYNGTDYLDMGLVPCLNNFTLVKQTKGGSQTALPLGTYRYIVTFVYDDLQESYAIFPTNWDETNQVDKSTSMAMPSQSGCSRFVSTTISSSPPSQVIKLTDIPTGNGRVVKRKIYRTKKNGEEFYFLAEINDNTTTTHIDCKLDATLFDPIDLQAIFKPPIAKYGVSHKDRLFLANLKEDIYEDTPVITGLTWADSQGTGRLEEGKTYHYKFAYLYDYPFLGRYTGAPTQGFVGKLSNAVSHTQSSSGYPQNPNDTVTIGGIDTSNSFSRRVVVFRTKGNAGSTSTYYPIGITQAGGSTYVDGDADGDIELYQGSLEQIGYELTPTNKSMPSAIMWSDVNCGDSFPPDNSVEIEANDNDYITGLISEDDGILIFKERNIYKLYTDREPTYWVLRKVVSNLGCTDPFSLVTISTNTHLFMSNEQIYIYTNGQTKRISDKIQPIINGFGGIDSVDVCYDNYRNWVVWTVEYTEDSTQVQDVIVLDLNFPQEGNIGSWYYFKHYVDLSSTSPVRDGLTVSSPLVTKDGKLLFGSTTNRIMQYGKTPQYQDTYLVSGNATNRSIDAFLTKYFDFDEWSITKVLGKFRVGGAGTVTVSTSTGSNSKTTSGADTKVRINNKIARTTYKVQEDYIKANSSSNVSVEVKEIGFEYEPKHQTRGSF